MDYRELMRNLQDQKFVRFYPTFAHHTDKQGGMLPDTPEAHAAWYYVICAHKSLEQVDQGAEYEGELDHVSMLNNLVRSISAIYSLESPDHLISHLTYARMEALRLELTWDERIERPYMDAYLGHTN